MISKVESAKKEVPTDLTAAKESLSKRRLDRDLPLLYVPISSEVRKSDEK